MSREPLLVYLDTADLIVIGDGKDPRGAETLLNAMRETGSALMITVEHAFDFMPEGAPHHRRKIFDAIEGFPVVVTPFLSVSSVERSELLNTSLAATPANPLDLHRVTDVRDVFEALESEGAVEVMGDVKQLVWDAERSAAAASQPSQRPQVAGFARLRREVERRLLDILAVERDPAAIRSAILSMIPDAAQEELGQDVILSIASDLSRVLQAWVDDGESGEDLRRSMLERQDPTLAAERPGTMLRLQLSRAQEADTRRNPRLSDLVDRGHLNYLPYVDLMTTDRDNLKRLGPHLSTFRRRRRAVLVANRSLTDVSLRLLQMSSAPLGATS